MAHLSLCSSQDDTMANYPNCDCGEEAPSEKGKPMEDRKCDNCANRSGWTATYNKVPIGPQAFAVAKCPRAYCGHVSPGDGTHCEHFASRLTSAKARKD